MGPGTEVLADNGERNSWGEPWGGRKNLHPQGPTRRSSPGEGDAQGRRRTHRLPLCPGPSSKVLLPRLGRPGPSSDARDQPRAHLRDFATSVSRLWLWFRLPT